MKNVVIRRPGIEDAASINAFFEIVIRDTFQRNKIDDIQEMRDEIAYKRMNLAKDIESHGKNRYFLIATLKEMIVGTIEYGPPNDLILTCTDGKLHDYAEIGTVFVHPDYQRQGIGNKMISTILDAIKDRGISKICLDSGYPSAQRVWLKKFGSPAYVSKDHWGEGADHMIWKLNINDVLLS